MQQRVGLRFAGHAQVRRIPRDAPAKLYGNRAQQHHLGLRRAETVMRSMVKAGIGFGRLKVVTQGEMKPKVPNMDARGMALNRRVVFSAL